MKYILSIHARDVMKNRSIKEIWVYDILRNPSVIQCIEENERHVYGTVKEYGERCLKVVINPLTNIIVTTYFDRKMKKKGCK